MSDHPTHISRARKKDVSYLLPPLSEFKIRWQVLISLVILHLGAVAAFWFITPAAILTAVVVRTLVGLLGVTVCYHRLLAHRAFKTYRWVKYLHLTFASISLQQGPISWVRLHRAHHQNSDTPRDPHPQIYGFWYGHMGWTFLAHKTIGRSDEVKAEPVDLSRDPGVLFFEKYHYHFFILHLIALYLIGGLPFVLWVGCFRTIFVLHMTWSVNSLSHRWGYRNFNTQDLSKNNIFVALLSHGEGWHNNHHRYPFSAKQGLKLLEFDSSWLWIKFLYFLGLAWEVRIPKRRLDRASSRMSFMIRKPTKQGERGEVYG